MEEIITKDSNRASIVEILTKEISRATMEEIITKESIRATVAISVKLTDSPE